MREWMGLSEKWIALGIRFHGLVRWRLRGRKGRRGGGGRKMAKSLAQQMKAHAMQRRKFVDDVSESEEEEDFSD